MSFIAGLHGTVAAIVICCLLFADEAGLPLPIAPNEILLLLIGVLIAGGAFPVWLIGPVAFLSMTAGMFAGYGWARTVGQSGLRAVAERVKATALYDRAQERLQSSSSWGIAVARMLPGVRPYATLVSGAAAVDLRRFSLGALPALLLWEVVWILAGMLVGLPVAHLLGRFQRLALRGMVLVVLGIVSWFAVRHPTPEGEGEVVRLTPRVSATLALGFDAGLVSTAVGVLFTIARRLLEMRASAWVEVVVASITLIAVLVMSRVVRTPGERLFGTQYWHHPAVPVH